MLQPAMASLGRWGWCCCEERCQQPELLCYTFSSCVEGGERCCWASAATTSLLRLPGTRARRRRWGPSESRLWLAEPFFLFLVFCSEERCRGRARSDGHKSLHRTAVDPGDRGAGSLGGTPSASKINKAYTRKRCVQEINFLALYI